MVSAVNEVNTRVKYEFDDVNLIIRIVSDVYPWRYLLPEPDSHFDENTHLLSIQRYKDFFEYRILLNESESQIGPTFKCPHSNSDISFLWGETSTTMSLGDTDSDISQVLISLHLPGIDQAEYFSKLKKLNKTILLAQDRKEYFPSGTPLIGKKEENSDEEGYFEEPTNFPE